MRARLDPRHWLNRAKEMRALAESVSDASTKERILLLAKEYEEQAKQAVFKPRKK